MIRRYADPRITDIWSEENKFGLWQQVELSYLEAQAQLGKIGKDIWDEIAKAVGEAPIEKEKIDEFEAELRHDLNAFVKERRLRIPRSLRGYFHRRNTSYDTEEPAMAKMLKESVLVVGHELRSLQEELLQLAFNHKHTLMIARTHGQEADLSTFGRMWANYVQDLNVDVRFLRFAISNLDFSKFSGAVGNCSGIDPEMEEKTLSLFGFRPYVGATQITPREIYTPVALALAQLGMTLQKIALAIRLKGRSGRPFCHEPFGKSQMGSSAMPHKKNNIIAEQLEGMARMILGYAFMLLMCIPTWEDRAIEQSCVERVAWPDLFHVTIHALKRLRSVVSGLVVYPENMLEEIAESGGLYATTEAKDVLYELGQVRGLDEEKCYRILQLAAFNIHEIRRSQMPYQAPTNLEEADKLLDGYQFVDRNQLPSFKEFIAQHQLRISPQLTADQKTVDQWNSALEEIFRSEENRQRWLDAFKPSYLLRNEKRIFDRIYIESLAA